MTEISFEDVRRGDRVRWTADLPSVHIVVEGEITEARGRWVDIGGCAGYTVNRDDKGTFELLHRPVPPAKCGDIREDPQTGARYVRTNITDRNFYIWRRITFGDPYTTEPPDLAEPVDHQLIARLRPVTP